LIFLMLKVKLNVEGFLFDDVIDVAFHWVNLLNKCF
jgi:hypothetical protein